MTSTPGIFAALAFLAAGSAIAQSAHPAQPPLSKAESAIVAHQIATLKTHGERRMAHDWSNAKKVSEMICRPAALRTLQRQTTGVDKVFLGTDDPATLTLESNRLLAGTGQYRTAQGWKDISFVCALNPATGKVTSFQSTPLPPRP